MDHNRRSLRVHLPRTPPAGCSRKQSLRKSIDITSTGRLLVDLLDYADAVERCLIVDGLNVRERVGELLGCREVLRD